MSTQSTSQKGRIALITGANKGLGLETARQLGSLGATVLLGARDETKGKAAADSLRTSGIDARFIRLEVTDGDTIGAAARQIEKEFGRLDILVNNAGVFAYDKDGTPSKVTAEGLRQTFDVNLFGLIAVTQAMLPLIRKSQHGRIVNLSSILGSIAEHADPGSPIYSMKYTAYDASKAALNMFTNHLAWELRDTAIKVNAAHPGWVKTDMGGPDAPMDPVDGAKTGVALATLPDNGPSGGYYHMGVHLRW